MKKQLLFTGLFILGISLSPFAQTSIIDMEDDGGGLDDVSVGVIGPGNGNSASTFVNPQTGGINGTTNCIQFVEEAGTALWNGLQLEFNGSTARSSFNANSERFFKFHVMSEANETVDLRVRLELGNTSINFEVTQSVTLVANVWSEVFLDLTGNDAGVTIGDPAINNTRIRIYVNPLVGGTGSNKNYYFDEFTTEANLYTTVADGDYNDASKWSPANVPTASISNIDVFHDMTYTGDLSLKYLLLRFQKSLDITGSFTVSDASQIFGGGSLIASTSITGNFTTYVTAADTNWHLISSPVEGQIYNAGWIATSNIAPGTEDTDNRGISTYDNGTPDVDTGNWRYYKEADGDLTFNSGIGYSLIRTSGTNYVFTGTLKDDNLLMTITRDGANYWNLVGNPYSSYLLVSDIISDNTSNLTGTHQFVYVWNNNKVGGAGYEALAGTDYINPGQAFFVNAANSNANNFTILKSKQNIRTGNPTFYKTSLPSIKLFVKDANGEIEYTEVEYKSNATTALDRGLDAGTFTGVSSNFSVFSHLVSDSEGVNFMKQSLPNSDYEDMVIPIGLKASAGEITFSSEALNLPAGIKVYLEDRENNTFTHLDGANSNLKITLSEALNGTGRFYLHTRSSALSTNDVSLENVSIYKKDISTLRVTGLSQGKSNIKLFNILGRQVLNVAFESNGVKEISLPSLAAGVYLVQLETENGKLNKKIILE